MKLSEFKGEEAMLILAELIDPASEIIKDERIKQIKANNGQMSDVIKILLKDHAKPVLKILALLNREDPETYSPSLIELPSMLVELLKDEELMSVFHLRSLNEVGEPLTSASENTEIGTAE